MREPPAPPEIITHLLDAVYPSFAMLSGMDLDLFTILHKGPMTVEQLAGAIGVQAVKLRPLLYALVVSGLLTVEDDSFANSAEADHYLVRGKPSYMGGLKELTASNWTRVLNTAGTIRKGSPLQEYDYRGTQNELMALFRGLYPGAVRDALRIMELYDFTGHSSLLDVGGGSGGLAITMVQANPHLKATILDLPSITPITKQFVEEAGAADRITIISGDAIHNSLNGLYDVVIARHLIQVLSADDSRTLLKNLTSVLKPGSVIHLIGWILDNSRLAPKNIVGTNLVLLNAYQDGQAYTEQEYHTWLDEAGFVDIERILMSDGASIMTARKRI